jgi:hypothetical protein
MPFEGLLKGSAKSGPSLSLTPLFLPVPPYLYTSWSHIQPLEKKNSRLNFLSDQFAFLGGKHFWRENLLMNFSGPLGDL